MIFNRDDIVCGLDVGTTKLTAVIADATSSPDSPEIIGMGTVSSFGLKHGTVVDISGTIQSLTEAVEKAERVAGKKVSRCIVGISGDHIKSINTSGKVTIGASSLDDLPGEVSDDDLRRVLEHASDVRLPDDREIIHKLPQEYLVDFQSGIKEPLGLSGQILEARVHLVTGAQAAILNLEKCIRQAGLSVQDVVLEPIASAEAVLDEDERKLGVILIDIGGGTTDVIVYYDNSVWHSAVIPLGGLNVTGDVSALLRTSVEQAEKIKTLYGSCQASNIKRDETFPIDGIGGRGRRDVRRDLLVSYIEARMDEILDFSLMEARKAEIFPNIAAGVVITGGGSMLDGINEFAEEKFQMPVRKGIPLSFKGIGEELKNPQYATGLGLVRYALRNQATGYKSRIGKQKKIFKMERLRKIVDGIYQML